MGKRFKPCSLCDGMMEYLQGSWRCPKCGHVGDNLYPRRRTQTGIGIRWGRGFEDRDYLHTSGMRDYLDHREAKQNVHVRVRKND
jgi:hypothetical protein